MLFLFGLIQYHLINTVISYLYHNTYSSNVLKPIVQSPLISLYHHIHKYSELALFGSQFMTIMCWPDDYYGLTHNIMPYIMFLQTHMTINSVKSYFKLIASAIFPPRVIDHSNSKNEYSYTLFICSKRVCMYILLFNFTLPFSHRTSLFNPLGL